jgi:peptide/nickel transport system substrate-binding protein
MVENALWHDGQAVTADDVVWTWQTLADDSGIPRRSWLYDYVDSITKLSEYSVELVLTYGPKPVDVLVEIGTDWILPEHLWKDIDYYDFTNDNPIGCGPFTFGEHEPSQYFILNRNADYYLDGPYVEQKIATIIPDESTAYYALSVGDLDIYDGPPPELEAVAENDPNIYIHDYLSDFIMYLTTNQRRWPNNITEFKHAVLTGIDREAIRDIVFGGRGLVAEASMSLPRGPFYNPDIPKYEYDPALANATFDSIGVTDTDADGWREANGTEISFDLLVSAEYQDSVDTVRLMADFMADLGIEVNVKPVLWPILWQTVGGAGHLGGDYNYPGKYDYDWAYLGWVGFWSDFHPAWMQWMFGIDGWWGSDDVNIPGWNSSVRWEVDALLDQIALSTDPVEYTALLKEAQLLVAQDLCYLPIMNIGGVSLYRNDSISGYVMGETSGPDNFESDISVYSVAARGDGFQIITAVVAVTLVGIIFFRKRKKKIVN